MVWTRREHYHQHQNQNGKQQSLQYPIPSQFYSISVAIRIKFEKKGISCTKKKIQICYDMVTRYANKLRSHASYTTQPKLAYLKYKRKGCKDNDNNEVIQ